MFVAVCCLCLLGIWFTCCITIGWSGGGFGLIWLVACAGVLLVFMFVLWLYLINSVVVRRDFIWCFVGLLVCCLWFAGLVCALILLGVSIAFGFVYC